MVKIEGFLKRIRRVVDDDIIAYVDEKMLNFDNKLEQAIDLYLLLGDIFRYNEQYDFYRDYRKTLGFVNVNLQSNAVVCGEWATIYVKLLQRYGIKASVIGEHGHYYVMLEVDGTKYVADVTIYGVWQQKYFLSDLANIKSGMKIKQFGIMLGANPFDEEIIKQEIKDLEQAILNVYQKTGRKFIADEKIAKLVMLIQKRIKSNQDVVGIFSLEDINYRLNLLKRIKGINSVMTQVEKKQLINKVGEQVFFDVKRSNYRSLTLATIYDDIVYYKLFIIKQEEKNFYFLENVDSFEFYDDINLLIDKIYERKLGIKKEDCYDEFASNLTRKLQVRY